MPPERERDVESRFAYLLQPIRDLAKNWDVDVASQLEDYISEVSYARASTKRLRCLIWHHTKLTHASNVNNRNLDPHAFSCMGLCVQ